jgi:hypothetical protein
MEQVLDQVVAHGLAMLVIMYLEVLVVPVRLVNIKLLLVLISG